MPSDIKDKEETSSPYDETMLEELPEADVTRSTDILHLLQELEEIVRRSKPLPMSRVLIRASDVFDVVEQILTHADAQFRLASTTVARRDEIIRSVNEEAQRMIDDAGREANRILSEEELGKRAQWLRQVMFEDLEEKKRERIAATDREIAALYTALDRKLSKVLATVRSADDGPDEEQSTEESRFVRGRDTYSRRSHRD
ncbi:MAG: hypothetical protein M1118_05145 [Chloroflexi bacterium]|nr:hypothetical protein [Chloroflexota bacterium]